MTSYDDARLRRPTGVRSLLLGGTKVTYVPDGQAQLSPRGSLPASTDEQWAAYPEYLDDDGYLVASVGGLLVEHGGRALLIDAGFGPESLPAKPGSPVGRIAGGRLLEQLTALGQPPAGLEAVAITHLHPDHVGWSAHLAQAGVTHLMAEPEWTERHLAVEHGVAKETIDALEGHVRTFADGEEIFPGVHAHFSPGHTVGHASYVISGGGRRLIAFGDAMHTPLQITHPEWAAVVDHDPRRSTASRRHLIEQLTEPGTLGLGIHFADVPFGRARRTGNGGPVWEPVDE
ncbi:MBL fold metallo-hydrolase [Streptomyces sp. I05A-00742]|uniref:MBL fold metallo-hydrolase n=1 Tax=Streptomyces sp. I05A-00742 TaxID=2732853 RepID=UPI00148995B5|nr:MBL fold metallo-hydrolase [Streptomyces sp. I05A-00742]